MENTPPRPLTDWLQLETAIDIIGNMIALHVELLFKTIDNDPENVARHEQIEDEIVRYGKETVHCYKTGKNAEVIAKAYNVYAPFIKANWEKGLDNNIQFPCYQFIGTALNTGQEVTQSRE